jgi:predicted MFS family arabinose efflux permease
MTPGESPDRGYKWLVVGILWFVCFFNYADRQAIFAVFPLIKQQLGLTDVQLGIVGAAFMWMYALFGPLAGWLCDRLPRKALVLGGLIAWSLVTALTALCHTYGQLVLCRALSGLGEAVYLPASMSLIGDYHGAATRSRAMSVHQSSVYVGSIAGGAISGLVGQFYGWRWSFIIFGSCGLLFGLVVGKFLMEPSRGQQDAGTASLPTAIGGGNLFHELKALLASPIVRLLILAFVGANFVAVVFLTWMPSFLYGKFHMSLSMAGLNGTMYLQLSSVVGVLCGGLLADFLTRQFAGGRMLTQALGLFLGIPFLFFTGWAASVPAVVLGMIGFGYCKGLYDANIFASLYDVVAVRRRGIAAGMLNSLGWLGGGFAPIAIALAANRYGMGPSISGTAFVYCLSGLLMLLAARRTILARSNSPAGGPS